MLNFNSGGKILLNIEFDRSSLEYAPGETIQARIILENEKELITQGGIFTINCQEWFMCKKKVKSRRGSSYVDGMVERRRSEAFCFDFLPEIGVPPGKHVFDTSYTIPQESLRTCSGEIVRVNWSAQAKITRFLSNVNSEIDFKVLSIRPTDISPAGEYGSTNCLDKVNIAFFLPYKEFLCSGPISGRLKINPFTDFTVMEVRVELVCLERVPDIYGEGENTWKSTIAEKRLAGITHLKAGQYMELPFDLPLHRWVSPGVDFRTGSIKYTLRASLNRFLVPNVHAETDIMLFNGVGGL